MRVDLNYIIGKQFIKTSKNTFARFLAAPSDEILLRVQSIKEITFNDYAHNTDQTMVSIIDMDPVKDLILIELTKDLYEPILYYACNGIPGSYQKGCNTTKDITKIDISIMEGYIVRLLGCLRESSSELLDLRPRLQWIETSLMDIYECYVDFRNLSGTLVEIMIDFDKIFSGGLNIFYPENTLNQILKIRGKNEYN